MKCLENCKVAQIGLKIETKYLAFANCGGCGCGLCQIKLRVKSCEFIPKVMSTLDWNFAARHIRGEHSHSQTLAPEQSAENSDEI